MSSEEFWRDDPQLFVSYRTSFINKKKREMEELDYKCWYQGLYIYDAIGKIISSLKQMLGNMFSKHKSTRKIDAYPEKPYNELYRDKQKNVIQEERETKYKNFENSLAYFGTMKQRYLDSLKKKKGE